MREDFDMTPPEELDTQVPDKQCSVGFQLFTSLLRRGGGWFANPKGGFERSTEEVWNSTGV